MEIDHGKEYAKRNLNHNCSLKNKDNSNAPDTEYKTDFVNEDECENIMRKENDEDAKLSNECNNDNEQRFNENINGNQLAENEDQQDDDKDKMNFKKSIDESNEMNNEVKQEAIDKKASAQNYEEDQEQHKSENGNKEEIEDKIGRASCRERV